MENGKAADSRQANTPQTEKQIIAATVGKRQPLNSTIYLAPYAPVWPSSFHLLQKDSHAALGDTVLLLEHVGSTLVPRLAAKPIVDMVMAVADSAHGSAYVEYLAAKG